MLILPVTLLDCRSRNMWWPCAIISMRLAFSALSVGLAFPRATSVTTLFTLRRDQRPNKLRARTSYSPKASAFLVAELRSERHRNQVRR